MESQIVKGLEALAKFKWKDEIDEHNANREKYAKDKEEEPKVRQSIPSMDLRQWFWEMGYAFDPADYQGMEDIYRKHCTLMANSIIDKNKEDLYTIE